MQTSVMLSIKPEYANRIFDGSKRFEFRRRLFANRTIKTIVVYATAPISKVIGEFEIDSILELNLELLWEETKLYSGISKPLFDRYFLGQTRGYALKIQQARKYDFPLSLPAHYNVKRAPQSFVYVYA